MLMIEFGMSTDYSLKLSKDVKRGLASKVNKGIRPGMAPLGFINIGDIKGEKSLAKDLNKFDLCKKWWEIMLTGQYTVEESLKQITKFGLSDRKGKKISKTSAFRFFHSNFYAGYFEYAGETHKGIHEAMVSLDEFEKVQNIISGKYGKYEALPERTPLPLSGFIKCGACGATITADRKTRRYKNGTTQEFCWYRCKKNKGVCKEAYLKADKLEEQVKNYISNLELEPRFIDWVKEVLRRRNHDEFESDRKQREFLTKNLQQLSKRKEVIYGMKIDGLYSQAEYKEKVGAVLKEEENIKRQLNSDRLSYWSQVIDETLNFATQIRDLFNGDDPYVKRLVLQALGSDLKIMDRKLYLEAKSVFIFLRNKQNQLYEESGSVGLKDDMIQQPKRPILTLPISLGADNGNRTHDPVLRFNLLSIAHDKEG